MPATPSRPKSCRNTVANVSTANCGTQSTPIPITSRQTARFASGVVARGAAGCRACGCAASAAAGGSRSQRHVSTAEPAHNSISVPYTAPKPACDASHGNSAAPTPPPIGTAVCRMLIASPRSRSPNQRITARPLDPFTLPPSSPTPHIIATMCASGGTASGVGTIATAISASIAAVAISPVNSTRRSPKRSAAIPHGNSDSATPNPSAPSTRPSEPLSSRYALRIQTAVVGMPVAAAEKLMFAATPAASTSQRAAQRRSADERERASERSMAKDRDGN